MTAQANATELLAAVNGSLEATVRAYDVDEVPDPRPAEYVEMTLSRRFGGVRRVSSRSWLTGYRATFRAVSQVSVWNARDSLEKCRAAVEYKRLLVAGQKSTPVQFETEDPTEPDEGWFSGLMSFTYTIREVEES